MFLAGYSMSAIWTFGGIENKHDIYRGEDCVKKFYESLRKQAMKVTEFQKKRIISLNRMKKQLIF